MRICTLLLLMTLFVLSVNAAPPPAWMAGSWRLDHDGEHVEEHWTTATAGTMLGMSKTVSAKGRVSFEFLRIANVNGKLTYLAMPEANPATPFPLKTLEESRVVFENPKHDFPQRILYWRAGEK